MPLVGTMDSSLALLGRGPHDPEDQGFLAFIQWCPGYDFDTAMSQEFISWES